MTRWFSLFNRNLKTLMGGPFASPIVADEGLPVWSKPFMKSNKLCNQRRGKYPFIVRDKIEKRFATALLVVGLYCFLLVCAVFGEPINDSLLEAARNGDAPKIAAILDQKTDINSVSASGRTALMIAAMNGQTEVVKILLDRGADVQVKDKSGHTAKQLARELGHADIIALLDHAAVVNDPQLAFFDAVQKDDIGAVRLALEKGADVNATLGLEKTALMIAATKSSQDNNTLFKLLLEKGASVNAVDDNGQTAFDYADLPGKTTDVEAQTLLIERGSATNRAPGLNNSLRDAVRKGDTDKVSAALAAKADPNLFGQHSLSESVLMTAARNGNLEIVKLLLKYGANPNRGSFNSFDEWMGRTALFFAAIGGHAEVAKALLEAGANVNVRTKSGFTPLMEAARASREDVVRLLLERGADPNAITGKGQSALTVSDGPKRLGVQQILIKAGATGRIVETPSHSNKPTVDVGAISNNSIKPIDSKTMTKTAWREKIRRYWNPGGVIKVTIVSNFKAMYGEPSRTETIEGSSFWYYDCSDGFIQLELIDPNMTRGQMHIKAVNDF